MIRFRFAHPAAVSLFLILALAPTPAAPADPPAEEPDAPAEGGMVEKVRVGAARLPEPVEEASRIPAHVTVYTREEIAASGAATVQEFLARTSDFVVFDEVGNTVQSTADIRGFNNSALATGAVVAVDGVRVNEPDTGYVNFALLPLTEVERIEVIRGSASPLFGEGGLAGAINVVTRRGGGPANGEASAAYGTFDTQDYRLAGGGHSGALSYQGGIRRRLSEGFRDNSDVRFTSFQGNAEWSLSPQGAVGLDVIAGSDHFNQPGALTAAEWRDDPTQNPFNERDFSATDLVQPSLYYRYARAGGLALNARLSYRDSSEEGFNGGRSGQGSNSEVDRQGWGGTVQLSQGLGPQSSRHELMGGAELGHDRFDTGQTRTDAEGDPLPQSDTSYSISTADSTRRAAGLFVQDSWSFHPAWSLTAGVRFDWIELDSDGDQAFYNFPPPDFLPVFTTQTTGGNRRFSQVSPRLGVNFNPSSGHQFYAGYSRGFRAPTVIELFAFPTFFSNPSLRPVESDDYEAGWSGPLSGALQLAVNAFWIEVRDEIFFVMTDPSQFIGTNLNLPGTRRRGAVTTLAAKLGPRMRAEVGATYTDATFQSDFQDANIGNEVEKGDRLPQIPELKLSARLEIPLPAGWRLDLHDFYVGEQVVTSDLANVAPRLSPYNVLGARVTYRREHWSAFLQGDNLLDRNYATRGIYAFNFGTFAFDNFYTPAPGRSFFTGLEARF